MAKIDANDVAAERGARQMIADLNRNAEKVETIYSATPFTVRDLLAYDTENDPACLLGRRWICKGGSCLWVAQSGIGKSALAMQAAILWALGRPFLGIQPARPLKSIFIQAENDAGDLAEEVKGIVNELGLASEAVALDESLFIYTEDCRTGKDFVDFMKILVERHGPDLVWIDPLLSYLGGDVSRQEACSQFLRNGLNPLSHAHGFAWMIVHHTCKPPRDPAQRNGMIGQDLSYLGIGSSELTNWPRAVVVLREVEEAVFELRAVKRGSRAGLTTAEEPEAERTTQVMLRHSENGICWLRDTTIFDREQDQEADLIREVLDRMGTDSHAKGTLCKIVQKLFQKSQSHVYTKGTLANRVFQNVIGKTQCPQDPTRFRVTE